MCVVLRTCFVQSIQEPVCVFLCFARRDQRAPCKMVSVVTGTIQIELKAGKGCSGLGEDGCATCLPLKVCVSLLWSWNAE